MAVLWGILRGKRPTKTGAARRTVVPWKFAKKDADFYVMKKGQNAGQIVKEPGPNTIGIVVDRDVFVPKYAEYMFQNIHNQGLFKARQKGTTIPFITNDDIDDVVLEWISDMSRRR
jgi:methionine aminopeptidase